MGIARPHSTANTFRVVNLWAKEPSLLADIFKYATDTQFNNVYQFILQIFSIRLIYQRLLKNACHPRHSGLSLNRLGIGRAHSCRTVVTQSVE